VYWSKLIDCTSHDEVEPKYRRSGCSRKGLHEVSPHVVDPSGFSTACRHTVDSAADTLLRDLELANVSSTEYAARNVGNETTNMHGWPGQPGLLPFDDDDENGFAARRSSHHHYNMMLTPSCHVHFKSIR
jgi:hypothetical protein